MKNLDYDIDKEIMKEKLQKLKKNIIFKKLTKKFKKKLTKKFKKKLTQKYKKKIQKKGLLKSSKNHIRKAYFNKNKKNRIERIKLLYEHFNILNSSQKLNINDQQANCCFFKKTKTI